MLCALRGVRADTRHYHGALIAPTKGIATATRGPTWPPLIEAGSVLVLLVDGGVGSIKLEKASLDCLNGFENRKH